MTLEKRVERQRRLVSTLEQRLLFERLVLQRLEGRQSRDEAPEPTEPLANLGDVYRAACRRAAR
ncbi:hypothetical protein [Aureimonas sp. N4]|uniref:hypothetical protein n=1 Tax=Aureimonas sp. N4 TaxID=1638165 RepID=UPI000780368E|nr:hypothetical protein [Aureimonas sp. N4]